MDLETTDSAAHRRGRLIARHGHGPAKRSTRPSGAKRERPRTLRAKLRYRFDRTLAAGSIALIGWLAALTIVIVLVTGFIATVSQFTFGGAVDESLPEDLWQNLLRTLDTGTIANDSQWPTRLLSLVVTLAGIFLAGALIGLIATLFEARVERLRRGRSQVIEHEHTLILGWSRQVVVIIRELCTANESLSRSAIVVLAGEDKLDMEQTIRDQVGDTGNTTVVCRSGDPSKPHDLQLANIDEARSVIVLGGDGDAGVIKAVLAIRALDPGFDLGPVVAEVDSVDHARTLEALTDGAVVTVNSDHVIAEVTAQACHQTGLSVAFRDLLDFDGDEIYFSEEPALVGHTYGETMLAFEKASVIGLCSRDGLVELNPPAATVVEQGDLVIVVAEDDSRIEFTGFRELTAPDAAHREKRYESPSRILVLGWSTFGPKVIDELDEFISPGSYVEIAVDSDLVDVDSVRGLELQHAELRVVAVKAAPDQLLRLREGEPFDQVIVLAYRDVLDPGDADAQTLLTLLTVRKVWPAGGPDRVPIIAELLDQSNLDIAMTTGGDDFIVSDALTSLMIAQLSERAELKEVFEDLFDPEGAVLELQPAEWYVAPGPCEFAAVVASGVARGTSPLGYRIAASGHVAMNPPKDERVDLGPGDEVLVIGLRAT